MIYGMDEARNMQKKELDRLYQQKAATEEELEAARERARLSVLKLTTKDEVFLRSLKVKA